MLFAPLWFVQLSEWADCPSSQEIAVARYYEFTRCLLFVFIAVLSGCCSKTSEPIGLIAGGWVFHDDNGQDWTYEFGGDKVIFRLDNDKAVWKVASVTSDEEGIIYIDVDAELGEGAAQSSTITVERLVDGKIAVSSGMHNKLLFEPE